ncbi:hypothetical protein PZ897_04475 [Hoeflea sp. YIM 152468]|uniref:hypothetical protein n=1 Tax=Hoeflea sp. YIM 152468 TaxID=3031759 RepID=UPI0023D9888C|nr:hypothetical protein [Hoeflea sp. YIM 152468]MDF1607423.1 hypothetical protein [Hoeflea sp. YIM 152468]
MALALMAYGSIIGVLAWAAWRGGDTEKVMFVINTLLLWLSAIWLFGYPALIGPAIVAAVGYLALLVVLTSSDMMSQTAAQAAPTAPQGDDS